MFFTKLSSNFFGLIKFSTIQGYPSREVHDQSGAFASGSHLATENGLQVVGSRLPVRSFDSLSMAGSTINSTNHSLLEGQAVRLANEITDVQCGSGTASTAGDLLKVSNVTTDTFELKKGAVTLTSVSACSPQLRSIQLLALKTSGIETFAANPNAETIIPIPMIPSLSSTYDAVSKILLDAPAAGPTTIATYSVMGGALITRCASMSATACVTPTSYRIAPVGSLRDAELLVGDGDPILLLATGNGILRYSLGASAETTFTSVLHPAPTGTIDSAKIRSLRLRDQGINSPRDAILYVEDTSGKHLYRTRDAGAHWYRVHTISTANTIVDIIPAHAHTKDEEEQDHWEPSFLLLERFFNGTDHDLRVISQDWHGF
jgi:hypothetical protein